MDLPLCLGTGTHVMYRKGSFGAAVDVCRGPLTFRIFLEISLKEAVSVLGLCVIDSTLFTVFSTASSRNSFLPICRVNDFETADILYPSE